MLVFCQVRVVRELSEGGEKLRGLMLMEGGMVAVVGGARIVRLA